MSDTRLPHDATEIERELTALAQSLDWPAEVDLSRAVRGRLDAQAERRSWWQWLMPPTSPRRGLVAVSLVAILLVVVAVVVEPVRSSVADRISLPGVSISTEPTVQPAGSVSDAMRLGERTTLDAAQSDLAFAPVPPPVAVLGDADAVYLLRRPGGQGDQLTYVYAARDGLPSVGDSGIGVLISQFPGRTNESFIQKQLPTGTTVEFVAIGDRQGFWISGEPHIFYYEDPAGNIQGETIRLAGNVLLWHEDGLTMRIESSLTRDEVLHIAASMQ